MILRRVALIALTVLGGADAVAQIAVSSNDNKAVWVDGVNTVPANPQPDTVTILDLSSPEPRVIAELEAPGGWSAPPQSVAVTPDESLALVASGAKLDPANPARTVFNNVLSVIDLTAAPPRVIATLQTGMRAAGVSVNPAGTLALVANRAEGSVSVFTISGKEVKPAGTIELGLPQSEPSLPVFTPDGRRAYVSLNNAHALAELSVTGARVEFTKRVIPAGLRPYSVAIPPSGDVAIVANIGNGPQGGSDTLQVVDLRMDPPRVVDGVFVGMVPEGIALSPDGRFVAAAIQNGAQLSPSSPYYHRRGILKIYALEGTRLAYVTEAEIGRWCQGAAWNTAGTTLVVQCGADSAIEVFGFDGRTLSRRQAIKINGAPTGIRTAERPPQRSTSAGPVSRSTMDGVFTAAQAARGRVLFSDVCAACHPDPFWRPSWSGRSVEELYTTIVKFMPDDNPGSVTGREAADVLAYILQGNEFPAGQAPLADDPAALAAIRIAEPPAVETTP
ncbi:MAG: YncE family protein [Vicinamibacterales bacterium]